MPGPFWHDSIFIYILYYFDFCHDRKDQKIKKIKSYKHEMEEGREKKVFIFIKMNILWRLDISNRNSLILSQYYSSSQFLMMSAQSFHESFNV